MIDIKGLSKAAVLAALHNGTRPLGMGRFQARGNMTEADAQAYLEEHYGVAAAGRNAPYTLEHGRTGLVGDVLSFDYVCGRPLKVDISGDEFEERLYDRDAGPGAANFAILQLRNQVQAAA